MPIDAPLDGSGTRQARVNSRKNIAKAPIDQRTAGEGEVIVGSAARWSSPSASTISTAPAMVPGENRTSASVNNRSSPRVRAAPA
jgi:hypothetical protein